MSSTPNTPDYLTGDALQAAVSGLTVKDRVALRWRDTETVSSLMDDGQGWLLAFGSIPIRTATGRASLSLTSDSVQLLGVLKDAGEGGVTVQCSEADPYSPSPVDREAARAAFGEVYSNSLDRPEDDFAVVLDRVLAGEFDVQGAPVNLPVDGRWAKPGVYLLTVKATGHFFAVRRDEEGWIGANGRYMTNTRVGFMFGDVESGVCTLERVDGA